QRDEFLRKWLYLLRVRCPAILDPDVATLRPAELPERFLEHGDAGLRFRVALGKRHQHADAPQALALLRPRRERPRCRRAAEQRDDLAPSHSITSSARASRVGGTSRPSALAFVRLIARSNFVGCSTGMSAGFAPRRILST